jgi:predicted small metal-binding protein
MKQFSCGDVVPGSKSVLRAKQEQEILAFVAEHATTDRGLTVIPPGMSEHMARELTLDLPAVA